jgi:hypothetical protein
MIGMSAERVEKQLDPRSGGRPGPGGEPRRAPENPGPAVDDAPGSGSTPAMKAVRIAERHLVGALIRRPGLFANTLADGRALDEAVTPGELADGPCRELYARLYDALAAGREPTLRSMLGDLAAEGEPALGQLLTECEAEAEHAAGEDVERIEGLLASAAERIVALRRSREYDVTRNELVDGAGGRDVTGLSRRLTEHLRDNPSPTRIARLRR